MDEHHTKSRRHTHTHVRTDASRTRTNVQTHRLHCTDAAGRCASQPCDTVRYATAHYNLQPTTYNQYSTDRDDTVEGKLLTAIRGTPRMAIEHTTKHQTPHNKHPPNTILETRCDTRNKHHYTRKTLARLTVCPPVAFPNFSRSQRSSVFSGSVKCRASI